MTTICTIIYSLVYTQKPSGQWMKMSILEVNDNFTLSKEVNGPILATTFVVELFLALGINLFVLIFTLCHPQRV